MYVHVPQNPPIKTHYIGYNGLISYCFLIESYMTYTRCSRNCPGFMS